MKRADFLSLPRVVAMTALAIAVLRPIALHAQVQASEHRPSFEVASVKQNMFGMADIPALVPDRILGGPDWIASERYNIDAKASTEFHFAPGGPPKDMLLMLRSLLEERFKLKAHRETREMPIFEVVVASKEGRLGSGLHKSSIDCEALFAGGRDGVPPPARQPNEPPPCRLMGGPARTIASGVTMQQLAANLSNHLERFVIDKTGLTDRFDFNLGWTPDRLPTTAPPPGIPPVDRDRKRIARLLIEDVTLLYGDVITLHLRCRGGAEKTVSVMRTTSCPVLGEGA
jgi:uncharacterized protein (TIGR03435 family)